MRPPIAGEFLSLAALKERGWTDALVRDFLGEADKTKTNPIYKKAAPMKLFEAGRVEATESQPEFLEAFERAQSRSKAARDRARKKALELASEMESISIQIPRENPDEVRRLAIKSYNTRNSRRDRLAHPDDSPEFLNRISVNYIRHHMINYEDVLISLRRRVGRADAYFILKDRVIEAIHETYPEFADY